MRVWDETGRLLRTVGPAGLKRPSDVAVDAFRNLYVADEELGVLVFNPQGQLLATIASPELKRPRAAHPRRHRRRPRLRRPGGAGAALSLAGENRACGNDDIGEVGPGARGGGAPGERAPGGGAGAEPRCRRRSSARCRPRRTRWRGRWPSSTGRSRAGRSWPSTRSSPGWRRWGRGRCRRAGATSSSRPTSTGGARTSASASRRRPPRTSASSSSSSPTTRSRRRRSRRRSSTSSTA